jgi:threonine/homoserine/homoserine lactone efflux protein
MIDLNVVPVFIISVLALLLVPGPDMLLISSLSISKGRAMGLWACLGNLTSGIILTLISGLGVASLIKQIPYSFEVMRFTGGGYLFYLAWANLNQKNIKTMEELNNKEAWRCYTTAIINNLMNPKALIFFVMFLPQFVSKNIEPSPIEQLFFLGFLLNIMGFVFNVSLVLILSKFVEKWTVKNTNTIYRKRIISILFVILGCWMLMGQFK